MPKSSLSRTLSRLMGEGVPSLWRRGWRLAVFAAAALAIALGAEGCGSSPGPPQGIEAKRGRNVPGMPLSAHHAVRDAPSKRKRPRGDSPRSSTGARRSRKHRVAGVIRRRRPPHADSHPSLHPHPCSAPGAAGKCHTEQHRSIGEQASHGPACSTSQATDKCHGQVGASPAPGDSHPCSTAETRSNCSPTPTPPQGATESPQPTSTY